MLCNRIILYILYAIFNSLKHNRITFNNKRELKKNKQKKKKKQQQQQQQQFKRQN